jgi:YD repeat-containing protein
VEAVSELGTALARAEELADGRAVSIFGANVARQVLALGRLDEIIVQVVPLILGEGVRLFGERPAPPSQAGAHARRFEWNADGHPLSSRRAADGSERALRLVGSPEQSNRLRDRVGSAHLRERDRVGGVPESRAPSW